MKYRAYWIFVFVAAVTLMRGAVQAQHNQCSQISSIANAPSNIVAQIKRENGTPLFQSFSQNGWSTAWVIGYRYDMAKGGPMQITHAFFKNHGKNYRQVLGPSGLADIFVPYELRHPNSIPGQWESRWWSRSKNYGRLNFLSSEQLPVCSHSIKFPPSNQVIAFVHVRDRGIIWHESIANESFSVSTTQGPSLAYQSHGARGYELELVSTFNADNYDNILKYRFRDDGSIEFLMGATSRNLTEHEKLSHLHIPVWRLDFDINGKANDRISVREYHLQKNILNGKININEFNGGKEGGINWAPHKFKAILISDSEDKISHYHVKPKSIGQVSGILNPKHDVLKFFEFDFWATLQSSVNKKEWHWKPQNVPNAASNKENLKSGDLVVWISTPILHVPRTEDGFCINPQTTQIGCKNFAGWNGVAHAMYTGVVIKPRNFNKRTPFYKSHWYD